MRLASDLSISSVRRAGSSTPSVISAVAANGFTATSVAALSTYQPGTSVPATRKGYDGSYTSPGGVPTPTLLTNIAETFTLRHQIRNAYPDDGSEPAFSTSQAALSSYAYSTDSFTGCTNSSGETSPKATCGWATTDRRVVGNSVNVQLVAFHRNARSREQTACVVLSATDGTATVYALLTASSVLTFPGGVQPFSGLRATGYETDLNITSLSDNADITVNAKVFPWIGDSGSIADSSTGTNQYDFAPLVFRKNTAKAANPPLVYIASTGSDATVDANGASGGNTKVSTTAATAKANAFLTLKSAVEALKAATNVTGGFTDGCEVRLVDARDIGTTNITTGTYQQTAALTITRDPASANRAAAPLTIPTSGAIAFRHSWVRFADIKLIRGANVQPTFAGSVSTNKVIFENVDFDNGSFNSTPFASSINHYYTGVTVTNCAASFWNAGGTPTLLVRGCSMASGTASNPEAAVCIGNSFTGSAQLPKAASSRQASRAIIAFNKFLSMSGSGAFPHWATFAGTYANQAVVQNLYEWIGASSASVAHPSADGETNNQQNLIFTDNTFAGAFIYGRTNILYDETSGTYRNHKLACIKRNCFVQWSTKGDYFIGANGGANAAESIQHTGNHNVIYAVDVEDIFAAWPDANTEGYGYDSLPRRWAHYGPYLYPGNSSVPTGSPGFIESLNNPGFKTNAATTYTPNGVTPATGTPSAGAGGGDYRPRRTSEGDASNSALLGRVTNPGLRYDLAGTARASTADTIGAYA